MARTIVLQRLTASARTRAELEKALDRKNVPTDVAQRVLDRMEDVGLVDDAAYAAAFVESRSRRAGWSGRSMRKWLSDRGVDRETVAMAVAELQPDAELATAVAFVRKRWSRQRGLDEGVRRRRLLAALARRGYSADLAHRAMTIVAEEEEES